MNKIADFFKKRWYLIIGLVILILFVRFNFFKSKTTSENINQSYTVKRETLKETLSLSGEIDAEEKVILRFQTSGRLAWVGVKEGEYVKKYQAIASLDKRDLKNRLDKYLNTYVKQRNNFEQTKDDYWNLQYDLSESVRNETKRILENNQYDLNNAVLDVEYQHLAVEYANLITPIEGIVTKVSSPFAGVNITPSQAEFEIVNPKTIYLSLTAEQADIVNLEERMKGEIIFDAYPQQSTTGEIYYISFAPKADETGSVYQIKMKIKNEDFIKKLKLGMSADVDFLLKEKKDILAIPLNYLKKERGGTYVYKLVDNKKVKTKVKLGEEIGEKIEIKSGLKDGDIVTSYD